MKDNLTADTAASDPASVCDPSLYSRIRNSFPALRLYFRPDADHTRRNRLRPLHFRRRIF
jgi:hypothetical protein